MFTYVWISYSDTAVEESSCRLKGGPQIVLAPSETVRLSTVPTFLHCASIHVSSLIPANISIFARPRIIDFAKCLFHFLDTLHLHGHAYRS
jgi:hypothetical protein